MNIDDFFAKHGEFGPHQRRVMWAFVIVSAVQAFHNLHHVYIGAEPEFHCLKDGTRQEDYTCPAGDTQTCDAYLFPGKDFTTVVSEWDLVCDKAYLSNMVQSIYMTGYMIGNVFFGWMADKYGRRKTICVALFGALISTNLGAFSMHFTFYAMCRFFAGVAFAGFGLVSFTYLCEMLGSSKRSFVGLLMPGAFAVGILIFSILAYLIRHWRVLSVVTSLPALMVFYWYWSLIESPRWLYSQGRLTEAEEILEFIVKKNTGHLPKESIKLKEETKLSETKGRVSDILRYKVLRRITLNNFFTWFVNGIVYYGLTMSAGNLGSNMYVSVALSGLVEIPAYMGTMLILDWLGRRKTYSWSMFLAGLCCFLMLIIPSEHTYIITALALFGKIGISISFSVAYVYCAELYPTNIRNNAIGASNCASRVGAVASPMILALSKVHPHLDLLMYAVLSFAAGAVALFLPETQGRPMPDTIEDLLKTERRVK